MVVVIVRTTFFHFLNVNTHWDEHQSDVVLGYSGIVQKPAEGILEPALLSLLSVRAKGEVTAIRCAGSLCLRTPAYKLLGLRVDFRMGGK